MRFRTKQMLIFSLLIALICSAFMVFLLVFHKSRVVKEAEHRRSSLAMHLHDDIIDMVYTGDVLQLTATIRNIRNSVNYLEYIFIIDHSGHLLAHTFDGGFPPELFNANFLEADKPASSKLLMINKGRIRDFAVRTSKHMPGEIHIGMNEEIFYEQINDFIKMTINVAIIGLAFSLLMVYVISGYLSKPFEALGLGMKKIENGDLGYRLEEKGGYEVLNLFRGYNRMTESILNFTISLKQANDNLTNILNSFTDGIYIIDKEYNIKFMNVASKKDFGPFDGEKCYKYFNNLDEVCPWCKNDDVFTGKTIRWEWYSFKSKKTYEMTDTPMTLPDGSIGKLEMFHDITKRKETEDALRKERDFSQSIIDTAQTIILVLNSDGTIAEFNPYMEKLSGYSIEEVRGKDWFETFLPERHRKEIGELFTKAISDIPTKGNINPIVTRNGKELMIEWFDHTLKDEKGNITGILATGQDITERRNMEEQLRQSQKMEAIGTLAGGIAHDFNNLLTVIIGNAELLLIKAIEDESLRKGIKEIKKSGEKAASLTQQLLAFSRKQMIRSEVLDLSKEIKNTEKMLRRIIKEDIELQIVLEPELWKVYADSGQINQVIMNIVVNAIDAMSIVYADSEAGRPHKGKLTIETANADLDENYFREHAIKGAPGSYVMLAISDTGCGMNEKVKEHIFEPFFTTKEVGKGTGLGLSTAYGIVKQNNGFIWVYSEPGKGATFKIYLPKIEGDVEAEGEKQTYVEHLGGSETVLIVEDDASVLNLAQKALDQHGYRTLVAENGEEALKIGREHEGQIDLMITDVVMPKMGGKEAADRLQPLYPRMKVLYMSGYTDQAIIYHGVLEPGLNFIEKPFTPEDLARKVRRTLSQK
ncbi:MAG: PAS domain S-box protein [Desulfobacterales bacterium]|nr:PAS domain S-box protein [Desulfobacterales bacterium]